MPAAAGAVGELLGELGGERPGAAELEAEARALVEDPSLGVLLVAEAGGELVGVLAASYVRALHVPGRYLVIQDLWVRPELAQPHDRRRPARRGRRDRPRAGAAADRGRAAAGDLRRDPRHRGLLPRQRLRLARDQDAAAALMEGGRWWGRSC